MIGPSHSIIARLISGGVGAAPCKMWRSDEMSYFSRTSLGSARTRWNMVATMWVWVTLYFSMVLSSSSGSNRSISTMVTPAFSGWAMSKASGAA